jgi:hypothetical protein
VNRPARSNATQRRASRSIHLRRDAAAREAPTPGLDLADGRCSDEHAHHMLEMLAIEAPGDGIEIVRARFVPRRRTAVARFVRTVRSDRRSSERFSRRKVRLSWDRMLDNSRNFSGRGCVIQTRRGGRRDELRQDTRIRPRR